MTWQEWWSWIRDAALLQRVVWGNTVQAWLKALVVWLAALAVLRFVQGIVRRRATLLAEQRDSDLARGVAALAAATTWWFLLVTAAFLAGLAVELAARPRLILHSAAIVALVLQGGIWGNVFLTITIARYARRRLETDAATATTLGALAFLAKLALWVIVVLLILQNLGVEVTALIAGLGLGGVAVALAAQNILGDLFASLSIILDKPFVLGDFIIVGDNLGTVEHIGLKTTRLRSLSGEQIIFSNNDLLQSRIRNFKRMYQRRMEFTVSVTYGTPAETAAEIPALLRHIVESQPQTRFDRAHLKVLGEFALLYEVVYFVTVPEYNVAMDTRQAINLAILQAFAERGIEFAYPTQRVYLDRNADAESEKTQAR